MKVETIEQLYRFSALDKNGDEVEIAYVARSLEAGSFPQQPRRNYTFVELLSVAHLEGVQRPSIATHEAPGGLPLLARPGCHSCGSPIE